MLPGPPSGKHATAEGCLILHWRDGKVAETWHFGDWLGWLQRIGVIPLKRSVSNTSDQGHRVFDSLLDAVRRWYVCDLIRDCVVPVLYPVETINCVSSPSLLAFDSQCNTVLISTGAPP